MKRPLIGVTCNYDYRDTVGITSGMGIVGQDWNFVAGDYVYILEKAGAIPVLIPVYKDCDEESIKEFLNKLDGVIISGGHDVGPEQYNTPTKGYCGTIIPQRDNHDIAVAKYFMNEIKKPILGICRGIQLLNVALGGDIYQDIPSQFPQDFPIAHTQPFDYVIPSHKVRVVPGTLLARLTGCETLQVNSMHHQACRKIAPGLTACGHAAGGLTEAIEKPDYPFFLGVQWHPEYLWEQDPAMRQLFEAFVKAAR